jgi:hypothetical protein
VFLEQDWLLVDTIFVPMIKLSKFSCYVDHKTYSGVACNNY